MSLLDVIFGSAEIFIEKKDVEKALNIFHVNLISFIKIKKKSQEQFSFAIRQSKLEKVVALLDKSGIKVYSIKRKGLPFLLWRYRKRYGIAVGALIFSLLVWLSKYIVWEIDFSGNENISDEKVEQQLLDVGFGVGSYIPNVNFYSLCNELLQKSDDFSFVSVNMEGTTAHVELRERKKKQEKTEYEASNIVAKYSGQVESMTVYSGQTVIEKEAVVKQGELLVSGFLERTFGFDIVRSTGSIYAYVTRDFEVEIPFEKSIKEYTENNQKKIEVTFFGKRFELYNNKDESLKNYDTVVDRERVVLFDAVKLPLILTKTDYKEYVEKKTLIDLDEAKKQAEMQLSQLLLDELKDAEVLERSVSEEETENSYKLKCSIYCLMDIAEEKEIIINKE